MSVSAVSLGTPENSTIQKLSIIIIIVVYVFVDRLKICHSCLYLLCSNPHISVKNSTPSSKICQNQACMLCNNQTTLWMYAIQMDTKQSWKKIRYIHCSENQTLQAHFFILFLSENSANSFGMCTCVPTHTHTHYSHTNMYKATGKPVWKRKGDHWLYTLSKTAVSSWIVTSCQP